MQQYFNRILLAACCAFVLSVCSSSVFAADFYIKLDNGKGVTKIIRCSNGECTVSDLPVGNYMFSVCDDKGDDLPVTAELGYSIQTAREASSGMATGRRQYSPIKITKEWNKTSPANKIAIDEPGVHFTCKAFVQPHIIEKSGAINK